MQIFDAIIIGAGFSGLYQLHSLRDKLGLKVKVLEAGEGVGGTWYWNRYPGARCDTESKAYSYYFSKELYEEWNWSERYPTQPEIEKYLNFVTDQLNMRKEIQFNAQVTDLIFDENRHIWRVLLKNKEQYFAKFVISAVGCLSFANVPTIPNRDLFRGEVYHTGNWPKKNPNLKGKKIGVIGTGSTGIQVIPEVAKLAKKLTVFQRTPNYSVPANNYKLTEADQIRANEEFDKSKQLMLQHRGGHPWKHSNKAAKKTNSVERKKLYEKAWDNGGLSFRDTFSDLSVDLESNNTASNFIKDKIKSIVHDHHTADLLTDFDHPFGSKRPPIDTNYYETFNRKDVELINIRNNPIESFVNNGIKTSKQHYELDVMIFATGFDALTGTLLNMNIEGNNNIKLKNVWKSGPITNLGLLIPNFPNLFLITGPGSPAVLTNMPRAIEQHVEWISECIHFMITKNYQTIETTSKAADKWGNTVQEAVNDTFFLSAKHSWYLGGNITNKPKVFIPYAGGLNKYRELCDMVALAKYDEFIFTEEK
jgi:cation diffusion facilitator CzcD-associated flavoprotein CzcO